MPDFGFRPGPVPAVQPGDIRNAMTILQPRRQSGQKGIFGDPRLQTGSDPSSNMAAVVMRTNLLLVALDQEALAKWREPDTIPDPVFTVVATYPLTYREDKTFDFDIESFVAALKAAG